MIINSNFHILNLHDCVARVVVLMRQSADGGMDEATARRARSFKFSSATLEGKHEVLTLNWYFNLVT